jgi:hypothetical protein
MEVRKLGRSASTGEGERGSAGAARDVSRADAPSAYADVVPKVAFSEPVTTSMRRPSR